MPENILKNIISGDYPILDRFKDAAPGTYKHSLNVMEFCESVANELNLDTDLLRVSAMYHDIGKMNNPEVFGENQNGTNMHDGLEPMISYNLITRHVGDSILILLQIPEVPREVLEIVSQHHGNTVLRYFFDKSESKIDDVFRYKCKSPQTTEAAVLMICDSVEATAKSLYNNGKMQESDDRRDVVDSTVRRLVEDSQLDEMKVGDLKVIKRVLYKELDSLYHKREAYGDDKVKDKKDDILSEGEERSD
jgi:putative nucleotidyltransferase with HDIG domain